MATPSLEEELERLQKRLADVIQKIDKIEKEFMLPVLRESKRTLEREINSIKIKINAKKYKSEDSETKNLIVDNNDISVDFLSLVNLLNNEFAGRKSVSEKDVIDYSESLSQAFFIALQDLLKQDLNGYLIVRYLNMHVRFEKINENERGLSETVFSSFARVSQNPFPQIRNKLSNQKITFELVRNMDLEEFVKFFLGPYAASIKPDYIVMPFIQWISLFPTEESTKRFDNHIEKISDKITSIRVWDDDTTTKSQKKKLQKGCAHPFEKMCLFQSAYLNIREYNYVKERYQEHCETVQKYGSERKKLSDRLYRKIIKFSKEGGVFPSTEKWEDLSEEYKTKLLENGLVRFKKDSTKEIEEEFNNLPSDVQEMVNSGKFFEFFKYWSLKTPEVCHVILNLNGPQLYVFENDSFVAVGQDEEDLYDFQEQYEDLKNKILTAKDSSQENYYSHCIDKLVKEMQEKCKFATTDDLITLQKRTNPILYYILKDDGEVSHIMRSSQSKVFNELKKNPTSISLKRKIDNVKRLMKSGWIDVQKFLPGRRVIIPKDGIHPNVKTISSEQEAIFIFWDIESGYVKKTKLIAKNETCLKQQHPVLVGCYIVKVKFIGNTYKIISEKECHIWGLDAVPKFVDFLYTFSKSYANTKTIEKSNRHRSAHSKDSDEARNIPLVFPISFNGANYDNLLIQTHLKQKFPTMSTCGTSSSAKFMSVENLSFIDLRLLTGGGSLEKLSESFFKITSAKDDFNLNKLAIDPDTLNYYFTNPSFYHFEIDPKDKEDCIKYCIKDCILTKNLYFALLDSLCSIAKENITSKIPFSPLEIVKKCTAASISKYLLERVFQPNEDLVAFPDFITELTRNAYFGGVTTCFKSKSDYCEFIATFILGLDINSSYPHQGTKKLPYDLLEIHNSEKLLTVNSQNYKKLFPLHETDPASYFFILNSFTFENASKESKNKPNIPVRHPKLGNYNPVSCTFDSSPGCYWGPEIFLALSEGCEIQVKSYHIYKTGYIIDHYMKTLYEKRCAVKNEFLKNGEKNPDFNPALSETLKMLINSLTGKFGQNINESIKIIAHDQLGSFIRNNISEIKDVAPIANNSNSETQYYSVSLTNLESENSHNIGNLVHIIGAITSFARTQLFSSIYNIEKVFPNSICYCDTDSMIIDVPIPPRKPSSEELQKTFQELLKNTPKEYFENEKKLNGLVEINSSKLGGWKIEKIIQANSYSGITSKVYTFFDFCEGYSCVKAKGICQSQQYFDEEGKKSRTVIKSDDIHELANGKTSKHFTQTMFMRSINEIFVNEKYERTLSNENTKRITLSKHLTLPPPSRIPDDIDSLSDYFFKDI